MRLSSASNRIFLLVSVIVSLCGTGNGQENYSITNFTTSNGLPHNHVYDIVQDKTGFLWIATWDGLSRFDGYEFKNYYHNPEDTTSLPLTIINKLFVDKNNNLWIKAFSGHVAMYDRAKDCFIQDRRSPTLSSSDMAIDMNGDLWKINVVQGLERYDYNSKKFIHIDIIGKNGDVITFSDDKQVFITFDNRNQFWLFAIYESGIVIYSGEIVGNTVKIDAVFANGIEKKYYPKSNGIQIRYYPNTEPEGTNSLSPTAGILLIDKTQSTRNILEGTPDLSEFEHLRIFEWSPNENMIGQYNPENNNVRNIEDPEDLNIQGIYVDKNENIWYHSMKGSTEGQGLTRCIPIPTFFKHYLLEYDKTGNTNAFFSVLKGRNGEIWAAARNLNYIFRINKTGEVLKCNYLDDPKWLKNQHARAFFEDSTGIWIGYSLDHLMYYNYKTELFSRTYDYDAGKTLMGPFQTFKNFLKSGNKFLYMFNDNINEYDILTNSIRQVVRISERANGYCLVKDDGDGYWAGFSLIGIKHYDDKFNETGSWKIGNGHYNVEDICLGDNEDLWIALMGGGLVHFFPKTGYTETFTTAHGLSNNTCYCILKDRNGFLWISTNHGISRFNPKNKQFRIFGPNDGLKIDEFNSDAAYQAADGEMVFGGMGGIVSFYPDSLPEQINVSINNTIVITDFKVSGIKRLFSKAVYEMDTIILRNGEDNFQLNFSCIDFRNSDKIKYRYKLIGVDRTFIETDYRHRYVNYANLLPGDYTFELEATNFEGGWVSRTTLQIQILPLYYQTWWFKFLILFISLSLIFVFILLYIRQVQLKASRKQAELRLESLRGQMNPHFIFNSLNSINYFISQNDRISANRYIADFSRLIRSFLGNLSKEFVPFESELETLRDYLQLEHLRFGDKFEYTLTALDGFESEGRMIFPGMVQPFIENAIWHGVRGLINQKGTIKIKFLKGREDFCTCIIEDDGIGRKLSEARRSLVSGRKSNGISIVVDRLKIISQLRQTNYRLVIEDLFPDREETGTRVTIEIPLQINN